MQVANIILQQLGGNKFLAMTGGQPVSMPAALHIMLPRMANGINSVVISLTASDTYSLMFNRYSRKTLELKTVNNCQNVQAEQLRDVFEQFTGLAISL